MKKNLASNICVVAVVAALAYLFFWIKSGIPILDSLVPAERCVKSAYNVENDRKRISINCRDHDGNVHTVIVRSFDVESDLVKIALAFKNGVNLEGFSCTQLNGLHACFSASNKIMVSSINEDSVVFYVLQFNKSIGKGFVAQTRNGPR